MSIDSRIIDSVDKFPKINFDNIDLTELIGGWYDVSSENERLPAIGWPDENNNILAKVYFDGEGNYDIVVVDDGGVKERYSKSEIQELNALLLWILVREDTIRKCASDIDRSMDLTTIYNIIKDKVAHVNSKGFVGSIDAGEMYYGGDVLIECLEYFGLDPYRKY